MKRYEVEIKLDYSNLIESLREHDTQYHTNDSPLISDKEYDSIYENLKEMERKYPYLVKEESPSQKVHSGKKNKTGFKKAYHSIPMLSLKKLKSFDEFNDFEFQLNQKKIRRKVKGINEKINYYVEPKLDGLAVELVYKNGLLFKAITRGDGFFGEDVTENAKTIQSIPKRINTNERVFKIRGEVLMLKKDFKALNKIRQEEGGSLFSNSRNAASGSLRQLDPNITKERKLEFYAYALGERIKGVNKQSDFVRLMQDLKIQNTGEFSMVCNSKEGIEEYFKKIEDLKSGLPFDIDGIVVKANDFKIQEQMGDTKKYPKWAIALKFDSETAMSIIKDIEIRVGKKTGVQTPIAIVEPVRIDGVLIQRVNLSSLNKLKELGIKKGDKVKVYRAGNVIPALKLI